MAVNINENTLKTLQITGQLFPIPGVAVAAGVALSILQEVQTMKTNKEGFIAIGRDSCFIVETVVHKVQDQNGRILNNPVTLRHIEVLVTDLRYIEKCIKKIKGRSGMKKIFRHQLDKVMIRDCRERLTGAMTLFGLHNDIEIHKQLASMHSLLFTLLEALSSTRMQSHDSHPRWQISSASSPPLPSTRIREPSVPLVHCDLLPNISAPTPVLDSLASPPVPHMSQERMEQRIEQDHPTSPTLSPGGLGTSIGHSHVSGDVNDIRRDDSFNVFGTGNHIYLSLAR